MKQVPKETEKFNFLIDSFKQDRIDPYDEAEKKGELARWFRTKLNSYKDGLSITLTKDVLARILRERTETTSMSVDHQLADKFYKSSKALYLEEGRNSESSYMTDLTTIFMWFDDHIDEPDGHLLGLTVDDEVYDIMIQYEKENGFFEILADNNIQYMRRGRIALNGYESWRVLRKGSIVIYKEERIFARIAKDVRIINENTPIIIYPNREESKIISLTVKDVIIMPSKSVNPANYVANNCGCLVKDREKQIVKEVLASFEETLIEGLKNDMQIDVRSKEYFTRLDFLELSQSFERFTKLTKEKRNKFIQKYIGILKQKLETKKMEIGMEKGYIYYPSWKRERNGVYVDENKFISGKLDEYKIELQGYKNEVEKQPTSMLQQLSYDSFQEKRDTAVKNAFIQYLRKFGFVPDSFDDQVAMKCPKSVETIYSNKIILDTILIDLYRDPQFEEFLQNQIGYIRRQSDIYISKMMIVLNEIVNQITYEPVDYEEMIEEARKHASKKPSEQQSKGIVRAINIYEQIKYVESEPNTPLHETCYGKIAMKIFYTMQNEFDAVYHMWGYDAFYKFHKEAEYEHKSETDKCASIQSIQQQLKLFESRKV